jgi:hypothetical protein
MNFTSMIMNYLTLQSRVLLEKIIVIHLVKKFPTSYGTQRFITMSARSCHWSAHDNVVIIIISILGHDVVAV